MSGEFPVELPADATVLALKTRLQSESAEFVVRRQRLVILDAATGAFVRLDHDDARTLHSLGVSSGATVDLLMECEPPHECPSLFPLSVTNGRFKTPDPRPHRQVLEISNPSSSSASSSAPLPPRVRAWREGDPEPDVVSWTKRACGLQLPCLHERFPSLLFTLEVDGCGDWDLEVDSLPRTAERTRDAFEAEMKVAHSVFRRREVERDMASAPLGTVWTEFPLQAGCSTGLFLTVESVAHACERLQYKRTFIHQKKGSAAAGTAASAVVDNDTVKDLAFTYCVAEHVEDDEMRGRCRRIDINLTTGALEPQFLLDDLAPNEWEIFDFLKSDLASAASIREKYPMRCLCGHNEVQRLFTVQCEYCGVRCVLACVL
jgi:hypothetical protein